MTTVRKFLVLQYGSLVNESRSLEEAAQYIEENLLPSEDGDIEVYEVKTSYEVELPQKVLLTPSPTL